MNGQFVDSDGNVLGEVDTTDGITALKVNTQFGSDYIILGSFATFGGAKKIVCTETGAAWANVHFE